MRVIRYALIAILLLSASAAQAQNLRMTARASRLASRAKKIHPASTPRLRAAASQASPFIYAPASIAFDSSGNLYIAAPFLFEILKVTPQGQISIFAGNGLQGYSGDDGPAVDAMLDEPFGVAVDAGGNVYIADSLNNVIREVTTNGDITQWLGAPRRSVPQGIWIR